jgi:hypothetical protein
LDVQVWKQDEVGERTSGLTPIQALTTLQQQSFDSFVQHFAAIRRKYGQQITTKSATNIAVRLTVGCYNKIYQQIDPLKLGEHQRAMLIAQDYGKRLEKQRHNTQKDTIDRLISNYPSHGFVIDRGEAETLFCNVRPPTTSEETMAALLFRKIFSAFDDEDDTTVNIIEFLSKDDKERVSDPMNGGVHDGESAGAGEIPQSPEPGGAGSFGAGDPEPAAGPSGGKDVASPIADGIPSSGDGEVPEL